MCRYVNIQKANMEARDKITVHTHSVYSWRSPNSLFIPQINHFFIFLYLILLCLYILLTTHSDDSMVWFHELKHKSFFFCCVKNSDVIYFFNINALCITADKSSLPLMGVQLKTLCDFWLSFWLSGKMLTGLHYISWLPSSVLLQTVQQLP